MYVMPAAAWSSATVVQKAGRYAYRATGSIRILNNTREVLKSFKTGLRSVLLTVFMKRRLVYTAEDRTRTTRPPTKRAISIEALGIRHHVAWHSLLLITGAMSTAAVAAIVELKHSARFAAATHVQVAPITYAVWVHDGRKR
eukprot:scaffold1549_cov350-Prasinococcus_capsulatus_cf.AAC.18